MMCEVVHENVISPTEIRIHEECVAEYSNDELYESPGAWHKFMHKHSDNCSVSWKFNFIQLFENFS